MTYQNFVLALTQFLPDDQTFQLHVSKAGDREGMPEGQTVPRKMPSEVYDLQEALSIGDATSQQIARLGDLLGELLFEPREIRDLLIAQFGNLDKDKLRLVLHVGLDAQPLADIAWEYVRWNNDNLATKAWARNIKLSIVRTETLAGYTLPKLDAPDTQTKLKVLVALSAPTQVEQLDLNRDAQNLKQLKQLVSDRVDIEILDGATEPITLEVLRDKVKYGGFHVLHMAGHGYFSKGIGSSPGAVVGTAGLVLMQPDGSPYLCDAAKLLEFLQGTALRLVVLATCQGGQRDHVNRWSSLTSALLKLEIPAVVGMQFEISDDNAIKFGEKFYKDIANGGILDEAVTEGRLPMAEDEWGTPVVYLRGVGDLVLFPKVKEKTANGHSTSSLITTVPTVAPISDPTSIPDLVTLRKIIAKNFKPRELDLLCADISATLKKDNIDETISADIIGLSGGIEIQALDMITYFENRGWMKYLVDAILAARPNALS